MTVEAAASSTDIAWITVAGTLGGVVVTALLGMLTAVLVERSQHRRKEQEQRFQVEREMCAAGLAGR
jgi:purine-cytosine permease-like protein